MNTSCSFARSVRITPTFRPLRLSPPFSSSSSRTRQPPPAVAGGSATCIRNHRARVSLQCSCSHSVAASSSFLVGSPIPNGGVAGNGRRRAVAAAAFSLSQTSSSGSLSSEMNGLSQSAKLLPRGARRLRLVVLHSFRQPQGLSGAETSFTNRTAIAGCLFSLTTPSSSLSSSSSSIFSCSPCSSSVLGQLRWRRNKVVPLRAELSETLSASSPLVDLRVRAAVPIATTRSDDVEGGEEVVLQYEGRGEGGSGGEGLLSSSSEREKTHPAGWFASEEGGRTFSAPSGAAEGEVDGEGRRGSSRSSSGNGGINSEGVEVADLPETKSLSSLRNDVQFSTSAGQSGKEASVSVEGATAENGLLTLLTSQGSSAIGAADASSAAADDGVTLDEATKLSLKGREKEGGEENGSWSSSVVDEARSLETDAESNDGAWSEFDLHRPAYHLQPPNSWMNDPNGPIFINGLYHLFYQHNPSKAAWDWGICWGHAVSTDLVHWEHRPLALTPTPGTYDQDGIFSGCCVNNEGVPTILYTGVQTTKRGENVKVTSYNEVQGIGFSEVQCIATFGADGKIQKHAANPVINAPPPGLQIVGFRDPFVWKEGEEWFMLLGSGIQDVGGTALLYKSPDLIRWEYVQPICMGNIKESGKMWECPLLINFGKWHMLCVSPDTPANPVLYWVGVYERGTFTPKGGVKRLDLGNVVYAPNCCVDNKGRQLLWGWVQEVRSEEACVSAGYAGCLTLPRVLSMNDNGVLFQEPPEEIKLLRTYHLVNEGPMRLVPVEPVFYGVRTGCLEVEVEVDRGTADAFGIDIREMPTMPQPMVKSSSSPALDESLANPPLEATRAQKVLNAEPHEGVLISYDFNRKWLEVSWWQPGAEHGTEAAGELVSKGGEVVLREGESLKMRVFLDRSVVEVFVNGLACLTTRMYRAVIGVALLAKGGDAELISANMWEMGSMWDPPAAGDLESSALAVDPFI